MYKNMGFTKEDKTKWIEEVMESQKITINNEKPYQYVK